MINILHMSPWPLGGATSYVVNLVKTLRLAGVKHRVVRLAERTERKVRQMGNYGVFYQNVSFADAIAGKGVWLLASAPTDPVKAERCVELVETSRGAYIFHDPNEFRIYPHWGDADRSRVICIREAGLRHMPYGTFIEHPYVRVYTPAQIERTKLACSIARTSAVKNSDWILSANARLPEEKRVELYGEVNRMWWNFNVKKKFPGIELPPHAGFPRTPEAAIEICMVYELMVDLTIFKDDGGGTQYSFLEAMDAGAVPVMTTEWCSYDGRAKDFGFTMKDADQLYDFLDDADSPTWQLCIDEARQENYTYLDTVHAPQRIAKLYSEYLEV